MYNISTHYDNLYRLATQHTDEMLVLTYLHPFGSTSFEDLEFFGRRFRGKFVIFCYDQEPLIPGFNDALFDHIKKFANGRPIILVNTERNSEAKEYFLKKYNLIDAYGFFHVFAAHDWYRGYPYLSIPSIKDRNIQKKFISFNRLTGDARCYRSLFVANLIEHNLIDYGHISYSAVCPNNNLPYKDNLKYALYHNVSAEYIQHASLLLDALSQPLRIDFKENVIPNDSMHLGAINENLESFLHVVSETCFWETKQHLTEKIFKPILLKQPFVLLGCAKNLEYLKSYGFKTFDRWWDESYDNIIDPVKRMQGVVSIIKEICNKTDDELKNMLLEMEDILEYNYELFSSKKFLNSVWDELSNNIITAIKHDIQ